MSDLAKKARAAMKSKAQRLGSDRTVERVDSSDFTPAELLNADVKTGLRPVSRRAFKKGGKVMGDACAPRADRKPRKNGGKTEYKAEATEFANAKVNRNVKAANEQREGKKHIGGMNRGGSTYGVPDKLRLLKTHTEGDNTAKVYKNTSTGEHQVKFFKDGVHQKKADYFTDDPSDAHDTAKYSLDRGFKKGGRAEKATGGDAIGEYLDKNPAPARAPQKSVPLPPPRPKDLDKPKVPEKFMSPYDHTTHGAKRGGKVKKAGGGGLKFHGDPVIPGMKKGGKVDAKAEDYKALRAKGGTQVMGGSYKKGGEAKHPDEAMDKALIKKMVKPEARKGKAIGGVLGQALSPALMLANAIRGDDDGKKRGGRTARKAGGKVKGKTNINIIISAGKPAGGQDMMQPPSGVPTDNRGAGGIPVTVPPPQAAQGAMPMPMPMPVPMPMHGGAGAPAGAPPMARKDGGRISKVAKSYKDMEAGSGSGEGRLQKTDIAKRQPKPGFQKGDNVFTGKGYPNAVTGATGGRTAKKTGGKVYRSYKDMDAGAGSGKGRLEKTEIEARKH